MVSLKMKMEDHHHHHHPQIQMEEEEEVILLPSENNNNNCCIVNIYPLSGYYFGSKEALPFKNETNFDRIQRLKTNYAVNGMRTCVEAVMLIELLKHPHLLVLQVRNTSFKLPGGRLRPGESEVQGLKRKLSSKLSPSDKEVDDDWEVGECLGMWWRAEFDTLLCPQLPLHAQRPKECTKLFLVRLPATRKFNVPKNLKLLAVPLSDLHENSKTYGTVISGVSQLLSRFDFNIIRP